MATGLSSLVRSVAKRKFVEEERRKGAERFNIPVSKIKDVLAADGFPPNHIPQICNALRSQIFLDSEGLELERTDGPPSMTSTTVIFHYRFKDAGNRPSDIEKKKEPGSSGSRSSDDPLLRMRGLLKDFFREQGGGEKWLRGLRMDEEDGFRR